MLRLPGAELVGVDGCGQRAAGLEVGQQHDLRRRQDRGGLGHEVDPAEDDHSGVGVGRLLGEPERVADEIGDVLHLGPLVVVREDHRVALVPQPLDPVQNPGPALCRNVPLCSDHPATCPGFTGSVNLGQIDLSKYTRVTRDCQGQGSEGSRFVYRGARDGDRRRGPAEDTFAALAGSPRLALGFAAVLGSGVVALALGLLANQLGGGGGAGALASLLLPVLFLVYWGAAALIIDAAAGLAGAPAGGDSTWP